MILQGKLLRVLDPKKGIASNGQWTLQQIIIEESQRDICLYIWNNSSIIDNLTVGNVYRFHCMIESKEYNSKWYTEIKLLRVLPDTETDWQLSDNLSFSLKNLDPEKVKALKIKRSINAQKQGGRKLGTIASCFGNDCSISFMNEEIDSKKIKNLTLIINGGKAKVKCNRILSESIRQGDFKDDINEIRNLDVVEYGNNKVYAVVSKNCSIEEVLTITEAMKAASNK